MELMGLGVALLLIGFVGGIAEPPDRRRRQRVEGTPARRIADVPNGGTVALQGRVVPGEKGAVQTAFSARAAVWFRTSVESERIRGISWSSVFTEESMRPFYVDDGSGQTARIIPDNANIIVDKHVIAKFGMWTGDTPPAVEAFLQSRGISTKWFGLVRSLRLVEEVLAPGDQLYVLGESRRELISVASDGDRATRLVLSHAPGSELLLSTLTARDLAKRFRGSFRLSAVVASIGAVLVLLNHVIR
jgi:hypothetical protein